jgi:hypothetical protein
LASAFIADATSLGRIIITEQYLPPAQQIIKPTKLPGLAGGLKYVVHSIMFKFCQDIHLRSGTKNLWMYGYEKVNNDAAISACGRELVALNAMFSCNIPELHFPLMAAIDYRGYRLLAISLLPVKRDTLEYGSDDAGTTVHNSNPRIDELMRKVGKILNIREHYVGNIESKLLVPCGDIEVHKSKKDDRFYVIDFQRLIPPEAPDKHHQSVFYNFLRPEFVKSNPTPLCSDTFTGFLSASDPNSGEMTADIEIATNRLYTEIIDKFVEEIITNSSFLGEKIVLHDDYSLAYEIHRRGMNLRHIGRIRARLVAQLQQANSDQPRRTLFPTYLLQEMCLRSLKVLLRRSCRSVSSISNEPIKSTICNALNLISIPSKNRDFWDKDIRYIIESKFGDMALQDVSLPLEENLDKVKLVTRLSKMCGFRIRARTLEEFGKFVRGKSDGEFVFVNLDIEDIYPEVKYMSFLDYISGVKELEEFLDAPLESPFRSEKLQLETACSKFQNCLFRNPSDVTARYKCAEAKLELLKRIWAETPLKLELDEVILALTEWHLLHQYDNKAKILLVEAHIIHSLFWDQPIPDTLLSLVASVDDTQLLNQWIIRNFWTLWKVPPLIFTEIYKLIEHISHLLSELKVLSGIIVKQLLLSPEKLIAGMSDDVEVQEIDIFFKEYFKNNQVELDEFKNLLTSNLTEATTLLHQLIKPLLSTSTNYIPRKTWTIKKLQWQWKSNRQWISYDEATAYQLEDSFQKKKNRT